MAVTKRVVIKKDRTDEVMRQIQALVERQVLVGIPESTTDRDDGSDVTNAQIGYVQETGDPSRNLPARPFLEPGVEDAKDVCAAQLKAASQSALRGDTARRDAHLSDAGILGANSVKRRINSNIPPPLAPSTIRNRAKQRGTKSRASERAYLKMVDQGASPADAQAETGIVALVNSGELRNSITSVVRKTRE